MGDICLIWVTFLMLGTNLRVLNTKSMNNIRITHSFSLIALSLPSLLQNSSKVASSGPCSLTRTCQFAPSPAALVRENVCTEFLWKVFPRFHVGIESKMERPAARMDSSEGISAQGKCRPEIQTGTQRHCTYHWASKAGQSSA